MNILTLPPKIQKRICEYAELTGFIRDLNYTDFDLYPLAEYPERLWSENPRCFHEANVEITRREDSDLLEEYWESPYDRFNCVRIPQACIEPTCDWQATHHPSDYFGDRATHPELFRIIMQGSHFRICSSSPAGFQPFLDLPDDVLAELGTLTVRLDGEPCESILMGDDWERLKQLIPVNILSRHGKTALRKMRRLVDRLAECITPLRLTLYIITKVENTAAGHALLSPLQALPPLKGCGIYLNEKPDPELVALAKKTVQRATALVHNTYTTPFRYLDLPTEVRQRILEFSDLVSKVDLEWKPSVSDIAPISEHKCSCNDSFCIELVLDRNGLVKHPSTSKNHAASSHCSPSCHSTYCRKDHNEFCACIFSCKHAAYASTIRTPRRGVHPLFLVSHKVHDDAIPVFFRWNRFVVMPYRANSTRTVYDDPSLLTVYHRIIPARRTELSLFVSSLPPGALRYIRHLEWVLSALENYIISSKSTYLDYLDTIDMMAEAMTVSKLSLVLNFRMVGLYDDLDRYGYTFYPPSRRQRDGAIYDAILGPLHRLSGLNNCFVYLRRLKTCSFDGIYYHDSDGCVFDNDEVRYEKGIMGSKYDSLRRGKQWLDRFERRIELYWCRPAGYRDSEYTRF
ncbi:hypothetical protein B0J11DRAFT_129543 [Dendryphion nanum]|uniref:Uncharacterized protein n=1 Tax=Dendryphion nanum TaxID=256645 RepID=A0A9P9DAC8_9PLEO|nr:hypothetical protein B0J11DRAFT_129543 [Dendryphion nanum]